MRILKRKETSLVRDRNSDGKMGLYLVDFYGTHVSSRDTVQLYFQLPPGKGGAVSEPVERISEDEVGR